MRDDRVPAQGIFVAADVYIHFFPRVPSCPRAYPDTKNKISLTPIGTEIKAERAKSITARSTGYHLAFIKNSEAHFYSGTAISPCERSAIIPCVRAMIKHRRAPLTNRSVRVLKITLALVTYGRFIPRSPPGTYTYMCVYICAHISRGRYRIQLAYTLIQVH